MHSAISHACGYNPISCEGAANTERLLAGIACSAPPSSWKQPKAHPENSPTGAKANQKFVFSTAQCDHWQSLGTPLVELEHVSLTTQLGVFPLNSSGNGADDFIVRHAAAHFLEQVPALLTKEAVAQLSIRSDSKPVAPTAESICHAGYHTNAANPSRNLP
mmetsp:Transcript_17877/g.41952  ORF Transcript_17877/g.41952 Transcript_17877/m.41952 type:complete len:161 (+) Transcript_17877:1-483(+)